MDRMTIGRKAIPPAFGAFLITLLAAPTGYTAEQQTPPIESGTAERVALASARPVSNILRVAYNDGLLTINATNTTLADILRKISELTGVKIDIPSEANKERVPIVELGPGPCRQILASLLSDSNFDYLIQAFATEPEQLQTVVLMAREKKGGKAGTNDALARALGSAHTAALQTSINPEENPVPDTPDVPQSEVAKAQASPSNPQVVSNPREQSNLPKSSPLSVPPLTTESMTQQLQQMYQQRTRMIQQDRPTGQGSVSQ